MSNRPARKTAMGRPVSGAATLALVLGLLFAGVSAAQTPDAQEPSTLKATTAGLQILLLPSVRVSGETEISPWATPGEQGRFEPLETALAESFAEAGYGFIGTAKALEVSATREVLSRAETPLKPADAAEAAKAAGADVVLVVRAEALRGRAGGGSPFHTVDALVEAAAYRAKDALPLGRATTRVTGTGKGEAEADAEAPRRGGVGPETPVVAEDRRQVQGPRVVDGDRRSGQRVCGLDHTGKVRIGLHYKRSRQLRDPKMS